MATTFKKIIAETEFTFYRTQILDEIVYFVLFGRGGKRELFKIAQDSTGNWTAPPDLPTSLQQAEQQFISAVRENEKPTSPQ
jgi:hypothetical protein